MSRYSNIPDGAYSITYNGHVKFFRVRSPKSGKWAGFTFVDVQAGDDFYPVKARNLRTLALDLIAADPAAASAAYGHLIGRCGICGRTLTNEESRAAGIGPVCAGRQGW